MTCKTETKECTGCMDCQCDRPIGVCEHCSDPIHESDEYYEIYGDMIHEECLKEWAERYRVN